MEVHGCCLSAPGTVGLSSQGLFLDPTSDASCVQPSVPKKYKVNVTKMNSNDFQGDTQFSVFSLFLSNINKIKDLH